MLLDLFQNVTLLVTLTALYGLIVRHRNVDSMVWKLLTGLWFGFIAVIGMMMPFVYEPGTIYDGRSIILTLAGLFGGGIASLVSILLASVYRIYIGGPGVYAGVATIVVCTISGLVARRIWKNQPYRIPGYWLYVIGLISQSLMLLCQLLLPWPRGVQVLQDIGIIILVIFPATFYVIALILRADEIRFKREIEIEEEKSLFRTTLYSIGEGIITTDEEFRIRQMNSVAEQLTGWTESKAEGKYVELVYRTIDPDTRSRLPLPVSQSGQPVSSGNQSRYSLLMDRDGHERPVIGRCTPIRDESGNAAGYVLVIRDYGEERERQAQLELDEAKYRILVESTDAIAWEYDEDIDRFTYMAPQVTSILGWLPEEWTCLSFWTDRIHPEDREMVLDTIGRCSASQEPASMEYRFQTKDSRYVWLRDFTTVQVNNQHTNQFRGVMLDITDAKQTAIALQLSEEKFRLLFENHGAVHLLIDPKKQIIENANQAAAVFYGWSVEELRGMKVSDINLLDPEQIGNRMNIALANSRFHIDLKHRLASGEIRDVEVFSSPVEIHGITYLHSIVHDITEKKELLNQLIQAKERAEESDQLKSAFLANMSHEIRTPLNGILGFTELITDEDELSVTQKKQYCRIISQNAETLMRIIDDILDLSRLETGQLKIFKTDIRVNDTLKELYDLFSKRLADAGSDGVVMELAADQADMVIFTDRVRFNQILTNLLDNSIKFTKNGSIRFGIEGTEPGFIRLFVSDTGIGIPKEKHQAIFARFMQAEADTAIKYGGTGLGLSIVSRLVQLLGGQIRLESAEGKGTTFYVRLPVR